MRRALILAVQISFGCALLPGQTAPDPQAGTTRQNGLYMTFETSLGNIECRLFEKDTPVTVRTMVGLALGYKAYVDPRTKQTVAGRRFFDGLKFHRVIPQFMIQGGDPLGNGTGNPEGPGFPYQDEFLPGLRFDAPGKLAMANAGPNDNGSQFFITEVAAPYLTGKHTLWGECGNLEVVKAIARVPAADDTPLKPVLIKRAVVERVGPAPANAPELPPAPKPKR
jgi:peptidyl-prolyl cis-trans isomerase A (cyclophilin A)